MAYRKEKDKDFARFFNEQSDRADALAETLGPARRLEQKLREDLEKVSALCTGLERELLMLHGWRSGWVEGWAHDESWRKSVPFRLSSEDKPSIPLDAVKEILDKIKDSYSSEEKTND